MIYWDNAATTYPKPPRVIEAVERALREYGANPGRGGYDMSLLTAEKVFECRQEAADFFGLASPERVAFTAGCTMGLNAVIRTVAEQKGHIVVSDLEHNAVMRPLEAWAKGRYSVAKWYPDEERTVLSFRRAIRRDTRLVLCTHASNVFGVTFPLFAIGRESHRVGALFCVDAAQSAGVLPIDMEKDGIDVVSVACHKGLYAPMGVGMLLCRNGNLFPLLRGGTGTQSRLFSMPEEWPERMESGTGNIPGIIGTLEGLRFVREQGRETLYAHEMELTQTLYDRLNSMQGIHLYTPKPQLGKASPVLSVTVEGASSEEIATEFARQGVAVRAGLHCAPMAHRHFGTLAEGTVRLAPSVFSVENELEKICELFDYCSKKYCTCVKI